MSKKIIYDALYKLEIEGITVLSEGHYEDFSSIVRQWKNINETLDGEERLVDPFFCVKTDAKESLKRKIKCSDIEDINKAEENKQLIVALRFQLLELDKTNGQLVVDKIELESRIKELTDKENCLDSEVCTNELNYAEIEISNLKKVIVRLIQIAKDMEKRIQDDHYTIVDFSNSNSEYKSDFAHLIKDIEQEISY